MTSRSLYSLFAAFLLAAPLLAQPGRQGGQGAAPPPQTQQIVRPAQGGGFTVDFVDADLRTVFTELAQAAGLSLSLNIPNNQRHSLKLPDPISAADVPGLLQSIAEQRNFNFRTDSTTGIIFIEQRTGNTGGRGNQPAAAAQTVDMGVYVVNVRYANNVDLANIINVLFASTGGRGGNINALINNAGRGNIQNQAGRGGAAGRAGGAGGGRGGGRGGGGDDFSPTASADPVMLDPSYAVASAMYDPAMIADVLQQQQQVPDIRAIRQGAADVVFQQGQPGAAQIIGQILGGPAGQALQALQQVQAGQPGSTDPRVVPMTGTNQLLIRATPADMALIQTVLTAVDLRPLQVLIEVSIVEVRRSNDLNLGVSGTATYTKQGDTDPRVTGNLQRPTQFDNARDFILQLTGGRGTVDFSAALNALAVRGDVKIVSLPVILAQNNSQAQLIVGEQRPFVATTQLVPNDNGVVNQVVQYRDVATSLLITPIINADGYVNLDVNQQVQDVTSEVQFDAPVISTRQAITRLFVKSGQTAVIGGMELEQTDKTRSGIPILSSIPILGHLFGATRDSKIKTELYLFLTPHVMQTDMDTDVLREAVKAQADLIKGIELRQLIPPAPDTTIRVIIPPDTAGVTRIPQRRDTLGGRGGQPPRRDTLGTGNPPATPPAGTIPPLAFIDAPRRIARAGK